MEWWIEEELRDAKGRGRLPRRRVMVGLALAVIVGTAAGIAAPLSPLWFWGAGGLLLLPLFVWVRHEWSTVPLMAVLFCLMAAHARQSTGGRAALSLRAGMARPTEYVQFVAVALEDAVRRPSRPGQADDAVFHARVEGLNRDGRWRPVEDRIRIVIRGRREHDRLPLYGERWRFRGIVRAAVPRRSGLFTLPESQAVIDPDRAFFIDANRGNRLKAWCMERRRAARAILGRGLADFPEERGLLQALLLGYREDLPAALRRDFAVTGTVHIFAISGAHVGMVALLLAGLLRLLGIPVTRWFPILTPLLVIYTLTTGAATSAIRASIMAALLLAGPFLGRRPDAVSALAVAAMAILVVSPAQLADLGFLLSFTAVGGLLAVQPILDAWVTRWFRRDEWQLPGEEIPANRRLRATGLWLTRYGSVTVSAWVGTLPLTAYFFNLFSPVALGMNLVVIPAAFGILLAGVMSLVSAPLGGDGPEIFNHAARVIASGLSGLIRGAAAVPGGHWFVRAPPGAVVACWYLILAGAAVMARRVRGAMAVGFGLLAVMALAWGMHDARRCRVSVLDAGEGNAVLVQAGRARILVDTGPIYRAEGTLRLLRRCGVNRLDVLVLTHSDARHMGAAPWLLEKLPVQELWVPVETWPTRPMKKTLQTAAAAGVAVRRLQAGDAGLWPGRVCWEVLWPPAEVKMVRADDASLVLRVARYGVSVLLAGDAGGHLEQVLAARGDSLASLVLLAGRHGDAQATTPVWLDAVRPRDVIISTGQHADGRHPDREVLARLHEREIRVWRTDVQGTVHVDLAGAPARWPATGCRLRTEP